MKKLKALAVVMVIIACVNITVIADGQSFEYMGFTFKTNDKAVQLQLKNIVNREVEEEIDRDSIITGISEAKVESDLKRYQIFKDYYQSSDKIKFRKGYQITLQKHFTNIYLTHRNYDWHADPSATEQYSNLNCGPYTITMTLKWFDESVNQTVSGVRSVITREGGISLMDIWDYLVSMDMKPQMMYAPVQDDSDGVFKSVKEALKGDGIILATVDSGIFEESERKDRCHELIISGAYTYNLKNYVIITDSAYSAYQDDTVPCSENIDREYADNMSKSFDKLRVMDWDTFMKYAWTNCFIIVEPKEA